MAEHLADNLLAGGRFLSLPVRVVFGGAVVDPHGRDLGHQRRRHPGCHPGAGDQPLHPAGGPADIAEAQAGGDALRKRRDEVSVLRGEGCDRRQV